MRPPPALSRALGSLGAVAALGALAIYAFGCPVGSRAGKARPPVAAVVTSAATAASAAALTSSNQPPPRSRSFDLASVTPITAHAALAEAVRAVQSRSWRAAADATRSALEAGLLGGDDLARARFLHGRLLALAKDDEAAESAWALVPEAYPLHPYAAVRRAVLLARKGKSDEALALLERVPNDAPLDSDRHFATGDALAARGDHAGAARAYAPERNGARWIDASIRYAEEVVAMGAAGDSLAVDAAQRVRRVRFAVPASPLVARAEEAEKKLKSLGPPRPAEETTAAQALLDSGRPKDAQPIVARLLVTLAKGSEEWCGVALLSARVHERLKDRGKASDAFGAVAERCTADATRVIALYDGAKAAVAAKLPDLARARFAALESSYPRHRLADDARYRGALIALDHGDAAKGEAMLTALPDDYPTGDMKGEALFRLALLRARKGDWAGAAPYLEKSSSLAGREDGYFVAGRAAYFLARAKLEMGATDDATARFRAVITHEPLSFAAAMSYARLCGRGPDECESARNAVAQGVASEPSGELFSCDRPELGTPAFGRAVELARVGEGEAARREFALAGLLRDVSADAEAQWLVAAIFARVGEARIAHGFARNRLGEWTRHFPGGKWRAAWEIAYPRPWPELVSAASAREMVPTPLIWAVMREESAFDPEVVSPSMAYGLLQLILPTAATYAKRLDLPSDARSLTQPEVNIPIGTAFLRKLRAEFVDNPALAVPSYNAGEGATRRWMNPPLADSFDLWVESVPYEETRKYTKRVLSSFYAYTALYDAPHLDSELKGAAGK